ncbi:hypothetical protein AB0D27_07455 [Streptomyces sp. NPDC048415]|uniref:hypothetical protein n=1 Tax=Streptomyces sp. NPDC048415 TaxID=3154822 RepID=UPI00344922C0
MSGAGPVTWREAGTGAGGCWAICGLACAVLTLLGEPEIPLAAPAVMFLARWYWIRHRCWVAGAVAMVVGAVSVFVLADNLRPHVALLAADALAVGAGLFAALIVFTGVSHLQMR